MRFQSRRAFTLVELLVVIAIIALLIGILLPSVASGRGPLSAPATVRVEAPRRCPFGAPGAAVTRADTSGGWSGHGPDLLSSWGLGGGFHPEIVLVPETVPLGGSRANRGRSGAAAPDSEAGDNDAAGVRSVIEWGIPYGALMLMGSALLILCRLLYKLLNKYQQNEAEREKQLLSMAQGGNAPPPSDARTVAECVSAVIDQYALMTQRHLEGFQESSRTQLREITQFMADQAPSGSAARRSTAAVTRAQVEQIIDETLKRQVRPIVERLEELVKEVTGKRAAGVTVAEVVPMDLQPARPPLGPSAGEPGQRA